MQHVMFQISWNNHTLRRSWTRPRGGRRCSLAVGGNRVLDSQFGESTQLKLTRKSWMMAWPLLLEDQVPNTKQGGNCILNPRRVYDRMSRTTCWLLSFTRVCVCVCVTMWVQYTRTLVKVATPSGFSQVSLFASMAVSGWKYLCGNQNPASSQLNPPILPISESARWSFWRSKRGRLFSSLLSSGPAELRSWAAVMCCFAHGFYGLIVGTRGKWELMGA